MATGRRGSFQQVVPGVFIGSRISLYFPPALRSAGITSLLAVNGMTRLPEGFRTMTIDARDEEDEPLFAHFDKAIEFVKSGPTLVFCDAGVSRSATIVAAYLIKEKAMQAREAIAAIRKVRRVRPNPGFVKQLEDFARSQQCELCSLEKRTKWYEETPDFVVLECEQCSLPMAVYRKHTPTAPAVVAEAMQRSLLTHAAQYFQGEQFTVDRQMRTTPTHFHFHARSLPRYKL